MGLFISCIYLDLALLGIEGVGLLRVNLTSIWTSQILRLRGKRHCAHAGFPEAEHFFTLLDSYSESNLFS